MVRSLVTSWLSILLLFCCLKLGSGQATDVDVRLVSPAWVARGGSATLRCLHQVPPQLLYKVEFLRTGTKLLQYVRERVPPFTSYTFPGGRVNMTLSTENSITIDNLDPSASGLYWCEVSLETPIFTAASNPRQLTVVSYSSPLLDTGRGLLQTIQFNFRQLSSSCYQPSFDIVAPPMWSHDIKGWMAQSILRASYLTFADSWSPLKYTSTHSQKHPPIITFGKPDVVVGGLLRANCTSAPAAPAPRLTWYIDNEKVDEESVKYFSYRVSSSTRTKGGGGYRSRKHQHRYIAPEFNYTAKYWALVSETTVAPAVNITKHHKCTLKDQQSEEMAKIQERPRIPPVIPISLWVSIAELKAPAHGRLQLTCTATIPDEVGPGEKFADIKKQTVTVAVNELSLKKPHSDTSHANATSSCLQKYPLWLLGCGLILREFTLQLN